MVVTAKTLLAGARLWLHSASGRIPVTFSVLASHVAAKVVPGAEPREKPTRSAEAARTNATNMAQSAGFPALVQGSLELLENQLRIFTTNPQSMGGSWGISRVRNTAHNSRSGFTQTFGCAGQAQSGCKWSMTYELTFEGWLPVAMHNDHCGHELFTRDAQAQVSASTRVVPAYLEELGDLLAAAGLPAKTVKRVFDCYAKRNDTRISWTYQDIYKRFIADQTTAEHDCEGFIDLLLSYERKTGNQFFITTDDLGFMNRSWVEMPGARQEWARNGKSNVLMIDATCGTNRYGMKLTLFVTVDGLGRTLLLAYMLHSLEEAADILWGLRCFQATFHTPPSVLFSDSLAANLSAFRMFSVAEEPWESVVHLLCIFHIDKNFYQHVRPLFASNKTNWGVVHNMFWRLAKDGDARGDASARLQKLWNFVKDHGSGATKDRTLLWITDTLIAHKQMWVAQYTWSHFTAACHSTSRNESLNSAGKNVLGANSSLKTVHTSLVEFTEDRAARSETDKERKAIKLARSTAGTSQFVLHLRGKLTEYGYELLLSQYSQALNYEFESVPPDWRCSDVNMKLPPGTQYLVRPTASTTPEPHLAVPHSDDGKTQKGFVDLTDMGLFDTRPHRITSLWYCSCQYPKSVGMVCRHMLCLYIRLDQKLPCFNVAPPLIDLIAPKWHTSAPTDLQQGEFELRYLAATGSTGAGSFRDRWAAFAAAASTLSDDEFSSIMRNLSVSLKPSSGGSSTTASTCAVGTLPASDASLAALSSGTSTASRASAVVGAPVPAPTLCYTSMQDMLKKGFAICSLTPAAAKNYFFADASEQRLNQEAFSAIILVKFGNRGQGGWHLAQVKEPLAGQKDYNCFLLFPWTDNSTARYSLSLSRRIDPATVGPQQRCTMYSWMWLTRSDLGIDVAASTAAQTLHPPAQRPTPGRPLSARLAPPAGPTSSGVKRARPMPSPASNPPSPPCSPVVPAVLLREPVGGPTSSPLVPPQLCTSALLCLGGLPLNGWLLNVQTFFAPSPPASPPSSPKPWDVLEIDSSDSEGGAAPTSHPSNGSELFQPAADSQVSLPADGSQFFQPADGSQFSQPADGSQFSQPADGSQFSQLADGSQFSQPADGSQFSQPADGSQLSQPADGSQLSQPADGSQLSLLPAAVPIPVPIPGPAGQLFSVTSNGDEESCTASASHPAAPAFSVSPAWQCLMYDLDMEMRRQHAQTFDARTLIRELWEAQAGAPPFELGTHTATAHIAVLRLPDDRPYLAVRICEVLDVTDAGDMLCRVEDESGCMEATVSASIMREQNAGMRVGTCLALKQPLWPGGLFFPVAAWSHHLMITAKSLIALVPC